MNEGINFQETLINILRNVARSSLPLYELKLLQLATNTYPQYVNDVQNVVFPRIRQICNLVDTPSDMLHELLEAYSTVWFQEAVDPQLILAVDMVLDEIYATFKKIDDEITLLQQKESRADFIGDLFSVVKRDIFGGAFVLQHRIFTQHQGTDLPARQYIAFYYPFATHLEVIVAMEYKLLLQGVQNLPTDRCARLRYIIGTNTLDDDLINDWLERLIEVYTNIAQKYSFTLKDLIQYIYAKEERNQNSHYRDSIQQLATPQLSLDEFISNYTNLRNTFTEQELDLLALTFQRCTAYLQSSPKVHTDDKITVRETHNPNTNYNANFMYEMNPFNLCQVADIGLFNLNGQQRRIPRYWAPRTINMNTHYVQSGHHAPN